MSKDRHLLSPVNRCERLYKFTILTPHTFLPPDHPDSLEDDLAEEFARYLCDRVTTILGARSYTPHRSGEAFLNMRFDEFEERFLRHSEYVIFITSGKNAASLDLIYPRMLVFLTFRPTWRNRGIIVYLGSPEGQKVFDPNLFLTKPLMFPVAPEDWESPETPWDRLLGRLQAQIPLTPEPLRSKHLAEHLPMKIGKASTNENAATSASQPDSQSSAHTAAPNKSMQTKKSEQTAQEYITFSERRESTSLFTLYPSSSFTTFRQLDSRHPFHHSFSLDDMCFCTGRQHGKSAPKKLKQRRNSEPELPKKSKKDLLCLFPTLKSGKKRRKGDATQTPTVIETPEVIRVVASKHDASKSQRRPLETHCLQVQTGDEIPNSRSAPHSTTSTSPSKRKAYTLSSGRRTRTRYDSGIVSNYSLVSTETSTSYPNLCLNQHVQRHLTATTTPQSFLFSSSPSYLDGTFSKWTQYNKRKVSPGVSSIHTDSSVEEQRGNEMEESLRFVDDENAADITILSDTFGMSEAGSFMKPGIPPLQKQSPFVEVITPARDEFRSHSLLMNPDSRASTYTVDDPTKPEDYYSELHSDSSFQREMMRRADENLENMIQLHAVHFERRSPNDSRYECSDSLHSKASTTSGESAISKSDLFITESPSIQNPTSSMDSVGSFGLRLICLSAENVISGEHPLMACDSLQKNTSPTELKKFQIGESNRNQGAEDSRRAQTPFSEKESSFSLPKSSKVSNPDSEILEDSYMLEESIEMTVNAPVQAASYQIIVSQTNEALLRQPLVQNDLDDSSESEESTIRETQENSKIAIWSKCDLPDQQIKATKSEERLSLTAESLLNATSKTPTSTEESSDSGLLSIGSPDSTSLSAAIDLSSLHKEEFILHSEVLDSIAHSSQKLSAAMEKTFETEGQYNLTPVHGGAVFDSVMISDHSMALEESHQDFFPATSINELSIMEKSLDSGIQSAANTLQKGMTSTSIPKMADFDQDLNASERDPTRLNELLNQEVSGIESLAQKSQDVSSFLPIIVPVQERPESAAVHIPQIVEEISSENMLNYRSQNEPTRVGEITDAVVQPTVKKQQGSTERIQESVQKLQREHKIPSAQGFTETDIDQMDTKSESLIIQREQTLKSHSMPVVKSIPSSNIEAEVAELEQEADNDPPSPRERRSIFVDNIDAVKSFDKEAYEIVRDMLRSCSPETLRLVRSAVKTYDKITESPELDQQNLTSVAPVISLTSDSQLSSTVVQQATFLRKVIPQVSVALINLSTAYIPRYISTIYDYSTALVRPQHPDRNLRELTTTIQEALLNHPLGMPILLAGTALISPWLIRQFPLTLMGICQGAPFFLSQFLEQPGNFLTEHFADITEAFQASPTWSAFTIVGSRGIHWRLLRPTS